MIPSNFKDITGQQFNRWTVIRKAKSGKGWQTKWLCVCICGNQKVIYGNHLQRGNSKSCGCLREELSLNRPLTHGHNRKNRPSSEYRAWYHMKTRCYNPNFNGFKDYGGRGITVCNEWIHDFQAFYDHIGPKPSPEHSLDRIDNNGNYEPGNVRWATRLEQRHNQRRCLLNTQKV